MLETAMKYLETAQIETRTRSLPYTGSVYGLWEDQWIACAEKLQHWDILTEFSKHESYTDSKRSSVCFSNFQGPSFIMENNIIKEAVDRERVFVSGRPLAYDVKDQFGGTC